MFFKLLEALSSILFFLDISFWFLSNLLLLITSAFKFHSIKVFTPQASLALWLEFNTIGPRVKI